MKTVLITGGSSGIGARAAEMFAAEGYQVAISFRTNQAGADAIVAGIQARGGTAMSCQADLTSDDAAKRLVETAHKAFGRIDVLVNNVGAYINGDEWNGSADVWTQTLAQNLVSMMSVSKYCIPIFQAQQSGVMVNIASRIGLQGSYVELAYGAAKAGVINITQGYARLLAPYARANSISPGAIKTGYWLRAPAKEIEETLAGKSLHRFVELDEVANMIVYLASDKAASITGKNFVIDN